MQESKINNTDLEIALLLEAIDRKYGYSFKDYSYVHVKRRVNNVLNAYNIENILTLTHRLIYDETFFYEFLQYFSVNVTEMFRDPLFYKAVREEVVPVLKTYPFIKIWHAGCSTGEEVYSMAILLREEGLHDRIQVYATDFNKVVLKKASDGIFPIENLKQYTGNYHASGGVHSFTDYYNAKYDAVMFDKSLTKNVVFAEHNLVTDSGFGEMHLIICRNVFIYFNKKLQNKVLHMFTDSLVSNGILCLGSQESLDFTETKESYIALSQKQKIYKKLV